MARRKGGGKIFVGPFEYTGRVVRQDYELHREGERQNDGMCDDGTRSLFIARAPLAHMRHAGLHELTHAIMGSAGLDRYIPDDDERETFVDVLTRELYASFDRSKWRRKGKLLLPRY